MTTMTSFFVIMITTLYSMYSVNASQQCSTPRFSCQFNNPCSPLCIPGQYHYPGRSSRSWVQCNQAGQCTDRRCPRRTHWNQENLRCEGNNGLEARCAFSIFDCAARNPCSPSLCEEGVQYYPRIGIRKYVSCVGGCSEEQCLRSELWEQDQQQCVTRPHPDTERCGSGTYNCDDKNPCYPNRCIPGVDFYIAYHGRRIRCVGVSKCIMA